MADYYDKESNPIDLMTWANLFEDSEHQRLRRAELPNDRIISTVWLGLDHRFDDGPPLIFESIVFTNRKTLDELDSDRYTTEAEALAGHATLVKRYS